MFWETLPGAIASWAAALAALGFIANRVISAWKTTQRIVLLVSRLTEIASPDEWPNGSRNLPQSITEIYRRQGDTHDLVKQTTHELKAYIVAHRADHGLPPPDDITGIPV